MVPVNGVPGPGQLFGGGCAIPAHGTLASPNGKRGRVRRWALWVGLFLALMGALAYIGLRSEMIERLFFYFPEKGVDSDPADIGLAFEDVFFQASDGVRLHGWFVPGQGEVVWLWLHGNAGNISHRLDNLKRLHDQLGVSVFLMDYRGYGRSEGRPTEAGIYRDAEAALAYLQSRTDIKQDRIVYFGRSLGAAVAVELATRHPPYGLILESAFESVSEMARRAHPFLPVWPFLRGRYDSLAKLARVNAPLLVLHGDRDEIVPCEAGKRLFEAASGPKELSIIEGAGHNDTYLVGGLEYFNTLRSFMERLGSG